MCEESMLTISIHESLAGNPDGWSDQASECNFVAMPQS